MAEPTTPNGAPPPGRVAIVDEDGTVSTVAAADVHRAVEEGARVASPEELHAAQTEARYGGAEGQAKAALAGAARGLTLGLSDPLAVAVGGEKTRETLAGLEEANPITSTVADVAGSAAPLLLSGGESAVARGLGTLGAAPRAAAGLGRLAERGAGAVLGEGAGVGGRVARALTRAAVGGAVEASAYGAGQAESEAVLGNHPLTAEQLLAHMGESAAFGGVLAGATHVPISVLSEGGRAIAGTAERGGARLREVLEGARPKVGDALARAERGGADFADAADTALESVKQRGREAIDGLPAYIEKLDARASEALPSSENLKKSAYENAWRSTYARKKFTEQAERRMPGGVAGVGEVMFDTGLLDVTKGVTGNALAPVDLLPRAEEIKSRVGAALGDIAARSNATVKMGDILQKYEETVAPLRKIAGREGTVSSLDTYRDSLIDQLGARSENGRVLIGKDIPVQELRAQRIGLQDIAYNEAKSLDPAARVEFLRSIRGALDDLEVGALVEGGADAAEIANAQKQYQGLSLVVDATEDSISRLGANRSIGATDYLAFIGGGGGVTGAGLALANKIARERGSAAAAVFLHDLATTRSIGKTASKVGAELGDRAAAIGQSVKASERTAYALEQVTRATERVQREVREGVRGFIESARKGANVAREEATNIGVRAGAVAGEVGERARATGRAIRRVADAAKDARQSAYENAYMTVEGYQHRRKQVEELDAAPSLLTARLQSRAGGLGDHAPTIAAALAAKAQQQNKALKMRLPPTRVPAGIQPFTKPASPKRLGPDELRWMRYARATDYPKSVIADMRAGTLSKDAIDGLRDNWPEIYSDVRREAFTTLAEHAASGEPLPFDAELALSSLLGVESQYTRPDFVAAVQATKTPPPPDTSAGNPPKAPSRLNIKSYPTKGEEIEA